MHQRATTASDLITKKVLINIHITTSPRELTCCARECKFFVQEKKYAEQTSYSVNKGNTKTHSPLPRYAWSNCQLGRDATREARIFPWTVLSKCKAIGEFDANDAAVEFARDLCRVQYLKSLVEDGLSSVDTFSQHPRAWS